MTKTDKIDLFKQHKAEYRALPRPIVIEATRAQYLSIQGKGAPDGEEFQTAIGALYAVAFTIKMTRKFDGHQDYVVSKLETQWWAEPESPDFSAASKDSWCWKLCIRTPDEVSQSDLDQAISALKDKGKGNGADRVQLIQIHEGTCIQMLHVGPYDTVSETYKMMEQHAKTEGFTLHGRHHDIYLSDPRRVPPERLKTILRHPVKR